MKKSNYTYVWVSLIVLIFGIIVIPKIVERIKGGSVIQNDRMNIKNSNDKLSYLILNGKKSKVPPFAFVNQDSLIISDQDYRGKVYVAEFFFTTCPSICPLMTKNIVAIQKEFIDSNDFGIASFTINPRYDTPIVLKEYAEKYNITNLNWNFLTGEKDAIYDLANKGFNIFAAEVANAPGGFEHSGMLALVDKNGYIRSRVDAHGNPIIYYRGTVGEEEQKNEEEETQQITILKEDIKKLLAE